MVFHIFTAISSKMGIGNFSLTHMWGQHFPGFSFNILVYLSEFTALINFAEFAFPNKLWPFL